jgi:hypothetical protein
MSDPFAIFCLYLGYDAVANGVLCHVTPFFLDEELDSFYINFLSLILY